MTWCDSHPESEQAGVFALVTIPKASLVPGGLSMQREMTLAVQRSADLKALAAEAIANLEEVVRDAMEAELIEQNQRRAAVGLPPLVVADGPAEPPAEPANPPPPPPPDRTGITTPQPGSPYRGRRNRQQEATP